MSSVRCRTCPVRAGQKFHRRPRPLTPRHVLPVRRPRRRPAGPVRRPRGPVRPRAPPPVLRPCPAAIAARSPPSPPPAVHRRSPTPPASAAAPDSGASLSPLRLPPAGPVSPELSGASFNPGGKSGDTLLQQIGILMNLEERAASDPDPDETLGLTFPSLHNFWAFSSHHSSSSVAPF